MYREVHSHFFTCSLINMSLSLGSQLPRCPGNDMHPQNKSPKIEKNDIAEKHQKALNEGQNDRRKRLSKSFGREIMSQKA